MERKIKCFEYIVYLLISWYGQATKQDASNANLSKLKLQKLLFLLSASNATKENPAMLNIFDDFVAMQYGPVESDIYNAMNDSESFSFFSFQQRDLQINGEYDGNNMCANDKIIIDRSFEVLRDKNDELICYSASMLVNITHKWTSWKYAMNIAKVQGFGCEKMNIQAICNDTKHFA